MKTICIIIEINILFTVMFQAAVLDSKSLSVNKKKLFYNDQSLIKGVSNYSVLNNSYELTENVNPSNIFKAHYTGNLNYVNDSGI